MNTKNCSEESLSRNSRKKAIQISQRSLASNYFFTPRTVSFATLATQNLSTVLAGILIFCCVLGLKPVRAFLFCFTSLPKPGRANSPFFFVVL
jgi:hypothetical protein